MDVVDLAEALLAEESSEHALTVCIDHLDQAGFAIERYPDVSAIVARRGQPGLAFSGHVDVVPVTLDAWSRDPFGNAMEDGTLYGRGASDMRGPVACMLAALSSSQAPAELVVTTDEETTMDGVRHLVDEDALEADTVIVGEPTENEIAVAGKGLVWARVEATGARGHASTPRGEDGRGPSAAERLIDALGELGPRPLRVDHPRLGAATLAISGVDSDPTPFNVLAGHAQARLDVRFPPPKMPDDVERSLRSKLGMPRDGLELSFEKREPAFLGDETAGKRAEHILTEAGIQTRLTGVDYVSEAGHWQRAGDTLVLGPGSIDRAHGPDEFVTREELATGRRAYEALVDAWPT